MKLTGRRRYRRMFNPRWAAVGRRGEDFLVLQVEVSEFMTGREDQPGKWACRWRDATPNDLEEAELVGR